MEMPELLKTYAEVLQALKWTKVRSTYVSLLQYRLELESQIKALQF